MNRIFAVLRDRVQRDDLILPTLPEMAIEIMRAFENDPLIDSGKVSSILVKDPSVSARIIRIANSAFIGSPIKITTLKAAVTRIGLTKIRNIVIAVVMEQLFVSKKTTIKRMMQDEWNLKMDSVCSALAMHKASGLSSVVSQDELMLYCLMRDIGILPVFIEFDKESAIDVDLKQLKQTFAPLITELTTKIMTAWGFGSFVMQYSAPNGDGLNLYSFFDAGRELNLPEGISDLSAVCSNLQINTKIKDIKEIASEFRAMFA